MIREQMDKDDLAHVDESGALRPLGAEAKDRLQERPGTFRVLPAPPHMIVLRREGDAQESRRCLLSGEIDAAGSICDVIGFIGHAGYKGELMLLDRTTRRSIYFDKGRVVGAQSTEKDERLGEILARQGILTKEQVVACDEAVSRGTMRFGEAAVERGFIAKERLYRLMGNQTEEIFYSAVMVGSGTFYLLDSYDEAVLSARQDLPIASLIREAVRRMHELRFFRARIPSNDWIPSRAPGRAPPESDPLAVFAAIDGARSIAAIARAASITEFETTRAVFQFLQSGHAVIGPPWLETADAVEVYNKAITLVLRELDAMDEGDAIRTELAAFAVGVYEKLFAGAGPADDGSLNGARIAENLAAFEDPKAAQAMLGSWLYDYASYALFLARPHLRRMHTAQAASQLDRPRVTQRITSMLGPIAPVDVGRAATGRKPT
jgi:hypothetical protein